MLTIDIITLFPQLFTNFEQVLPFNRALLDKSLKLNLHNLRDFAIDNRGTVDDKPFGGGTGMILRIEPVYNALKTIKKQNNSKTIIMSPKGKTFNQKKATEYSKLEQLIIICGRYEGFDARISEHLVDEVVSIGDFVLAGGEVASLAIIESTVRLLDGVLAPEVTSNDSFSKKVTEDATTTDEAFIEHPQYTRPQEFNGMNVPEVLVSGDHKKIEEWKRQNSKVH